MSRPTSTPWGMSQTTTEIAPGIVAYTTASHGGYHLSDARVASMPKPLRDFVPFGGPQAGPGRWYEEDCDWSVVALAFPQFFPADYQPAALATLKGYKPELFAEMVALIESQGKQVYSIHYADRELAREHGDPTLGVVTASSKEEAEFIASKDRDINRKAMPCASLWAAKVKLPATEKGR